jgi:hypothetical protein
MSERRVFVYVMTHTGDPDERGCWGCEDCMGRKRAYPYDAVIGVGGVEAMDHGFGGKVKWIGIGPHRTYVARKSGPEVRFDHFLEFGTEGCLIPAKLAKHIRRAPRGFMNLTIGEFDEAKKLLAKARKASRSPALAKPIAGSNQADLAYSCSRLPRGQRRPGKRCPR